jgi:hypothetical protein
MAQKIPAKQTRKLRYLEEDERNGRIDMNGHLDAKLLLPEKIAGQNGERFRVRLLRGRNPRKLARVTWPKSTETVERD